MRTTIDKLYQDIWQEIFEYFNAAELFVTLVHLTTQADDVLFNRNRRLCIRGLVLDAHLSTLLDNIWRSRIISAELHEKCLLGNIQHYVELRSLKLTGDPHWIIDVIGTISKVNTRLEQLTLFVPGISLLHNLLASMSLLHSLRRVEIHGNQVEERIKNGTSFDSPTKIEQFILHSCSPIGWNDLARLLPGLSNIRFLSITLVHLKKDSLCSFIFPNLHSLSLELVEVPFSTVTQLLIKMPSIVKLRLSGLVDTEGFIINNKWITLFEFCLSLKKVIVNLSVAEDANAFYNESIQSILGQINLDLRRISNDFDQINQHHWYSLSGTLLKCFAIDEL